MPAFREITIFPRSWPSWDRPRLTGCRQELMSLFPCTGGACKQPRGQPRHQKGPNHLQNFRRNLQQERHIIDNHTHTRTHTRTLARTPTLNMAHSCAAGCSREGARNRVVGAVIGRQHRNGGAQHPDPLVHEMGRVGHKQVGPTLALAKQGEAKRFAGTRSL